MAHSNDLVVAVQAAAHQVQATSAGPAMWRAACVVEWAGILMAARQRRDAQGEAMAFSALGNLFSVESIPGQCIVDPESGRMFAVHDRWPKCRFNSPEAAAARIARTSDPKALAAIKQQAIVPSACNCEWCLVAQFDFGGAEYQAWMRAHKVAQETWPAAYWHRLYPALAFVAAGVKTEAEAFAA